MCTSANHIVKNGDTVDILYTGKLKDQTIFDSTDDKGPFRFTVGSENIIKGVSDAVIGMKVGEKKTVEISADQAYGPYNEKLLAKIPRTNIPSDAKVSDVLTDSNNNNWWVREINNNYAIIDSNHPLAGQILVFDIELIRIDH